ncbi:hypothetical protein ACFLZJ_00935 [Nanoarchaeota archaeon]
MSSPEETKGIRAVFILEVLGKPPEHLEDALENVTKSIDKEKGVSVKGKKIKKPVELKDKKGFYTTYAEIEIEVEGILHLAILMFKYMPAHIDIISPELIALTNNGWNDILNELTRRLHGYDEVARVLQIEKSILEKKLREGLGQKTTPSKKAKKKPVKKKAKKK